MERTSSFGYWLRRRRKALHLTQEHLARQVGCSVETIKKIETDVRRSAHTMHAHLRSIYGKLEVTSRAPATRFAVEHQLV